MGISHLSMNLQKDSQRSSFFKSGFASTKDILDALFTGAETIADTDDATGITGLVID